MLRAFAETNITLTLGIPDAKLASLLRPSATQLWVEEHISDHPAAHITSIIVGDAAAICDAALAAEIAVVVGLLTEALHVAGIIGIVVFTFPSAGRGSSLAPAPFHVPEWDYRTDSSERLLTPAGLVGVIISSFVVGGAIIGTAVYRWTQRQRRLRDRMVD